MNTSAVQKNLSPAWKQEVNRRLAEHQGRKGNAPAQPQTPAEAHHNASSRAMEAAARVAARYANAPSFNEMLATEARAALRAAEAASEAALKARAAAQSVLAGIEAASDAGRPARAQAPALHPALFKPEPAQETMRVAITVEEPPAATPARQPVSVRFEPELPMRKPEPGHTYLTRGQDHFAAPSAGVEDWWSGAATEEDAAAEEIEVVEPQPIYANLIEFPRELVAARKVRPRLTEGPQAAEAGMQLSIFEVDPGAIATELEPETAAAREQHVLAAPRWSGIQLDALPRLEEMELLEDPDPAANPIPSIEPAPFNRRMMAMCVDFALISGSLLAVAMTAASRLQALPGLRTIELGAGLALLVAGAFYHTLFFTLGRSTPGMKYACIQLATFEGLMPNRAQRWGRVMALLVSVVPAGLGVAWALFDDEHLCWHDRLSKTYLRRR